MRYRVPFVASNSNLYHVSVTAILHCIITAPDCVNKTDIELFCILALVQPHYLQCSISEWHASKSTSTMGSINPMLSLVYNFVNSWQNGNVTEKIAMIYGKLEYDYRLSTSKPAFWGIPPPPPYWVILDPKSKEDKVKVTNLKNLPKLQVFKFWTKLYTSHTFRSCLIRCVNMKWIRHEFLKIQSRHDSVHRWTDGRTDRRTKWNQYTPLSTSLKGGGGYNKTWITTLHNWIQ